MIENTPTTLDKIIPWVVGIIGLYILYRPLKEPLTPLFSGIGNFIGKIKGKISGEDDGQYEEIKTLEYQ